MPRGDKNERQELRVTHENKRERAMVNDIVRGFIATAIVKCFALFVYDNFRAMVFASKTFE